MLEIPRTQQISTSRHWILVEARYSRSYFIIIIIPYLIFQTQLDDSRACVGAGGEPPSAMAPLDTSAAAASDATVAHHPPSLTSSPYSSAAAASAMSSMYAASAAGANAFTNRSVISINNSGLFHCGPPQLAREHLSSFFLFCFSNNFQQ